MKNEVLVDSILNMKAFDYDYENDMDKDKDFAWINLNLVQRYLI